MKRILFVFAFIVATRIHLVWGCPADCPKSGEIKLADGRIMEVCDCRKKPSPTPPPKKNPPPTEKTATTPRM